MSANGDPIHAIETAPGMLATTTRLGRLMRKELREILRDRRTIVTLILMPLLLYPLMTLAFRQFLLTSAAAAAGPAAYQLGFATKQEKLLVQRFLELPENSDVENAAAAPESPNARDVPLEYLVRTDLETALRNGEIDVAIRVSGAVQNAVRADRNLAFDCEMYYADVSYAREAIRYLEERFARSNTAFLAARLERLKIRQRAVPVQIIHQPIKVPTAPGGGALAVLVPLVLILMTITGAVYPSIDLTAGERERGTLEILIAAPIPRMGLLAAKYVAVLTVAILTALVNLGMMTVTLLASGLGVRVLGQAGLSVQTIAAVLGLLFLFAAFFSAVLLAVTSFARSFKEAQAFIIPLMLAAIAPGLLSMVPGLKLAGPLSVVPLVNIVLLSRDLFDGSATPMLSFLVVSSTLLYAIAAILLAARIFGAEAVLYSDQAGWSSVFNRPLVKRDAPTLSGAMLCLALMFPAYFLLTGFLSQREIDRMETKLLLNGAAVVVLFGGFPLVAALLGRVRLVPAFQLHSPPIAVVGGAALLGVSLWIPQHALIAALERFGTSTIPPAFAQRIAEAIQQWRALSPVWIVVTMAILPAIFEELFFRGYLYSAFRFRTSAPKAIFGTALLFGLFHLFFGDSFSIVRFLFSMVLGGVLGWVRWRSGSIFPGMVQHACHNSCLLLLAHYEPVLIEHGWLTGGNEPLPQFWFVGAGIGAVVGLLLVWLGSGKKAR